MTMDNDRWETTKPTVRQFVSDYLSSFALSGMLVVEGTWESLDMLPTKVVNPFRKVR